MTDTPNVSGSASGETNQIPTTGREPTSSQEPTDNPLEWRFDLDFNFNPNWLNSSGPAGRQLPAPLAMFNDWVRTNIATNTSPVTPPLHSQSNPSIPTNLLSTGFLTNSAPVVVNMTGTGPRPPTTSDPDIPPDNSHILMSHGGSFPVRATRSAPQARNVPDPDSDPDFRPSSPNPSRRDSRAYVVDVEANADWSPGPGSEVGGREEESLIDSPTERTPAEIIRQSPEARAFLAVLERYAPFLLILFLKGLFDHGSGIVCFFALLISFSHANTLLKKEVAKQGKRGVLYLSMISANLLICVGFMYYVFQDQCLYPALVFLPTKLEPATVYNLLWIVCLTDYVAKFCTVILKASIVALPEQVLPFQKRGKYYLFIESTSQFYRSLLPMYPWLFYLYEAYDGTYKIFSILLCSLYFMCKAVDLVQRFKAWRIAFAKFLQPVHYGTTPSAEELVDVGPSCPICHDSFTCPTRLSCSHIFCEECVSTWFDRERTCPMCRARVVDDPMYRDGSTTHFIQIF